MHCGAPRPSTYLRPHEPLEGAGVGMRSGTDHILPVHVVEGLGPAQTGEREEQQLAHVGCRCRGDERLIKRLFSKGVMPTG